MPDQDHLSVAPCTASPELPHRADEKRANTALGVMRELCSSCSIRQECLDSALPYSDVTGVWGGMTSKERQDLRHRLGVRARRAFRTPRLITPAPRRNSEAA